MTLIALPLWPMLQCIKATRSEACFSRHKSYVRPELILRLDCRRRYLVCHLFDRLKVALTPLRVPDLKGKESQKMGGLMCKNPHHNSWLVLASLALEVMSVGAVFLLC